MLELKNQIQSKVKTDLDKQQREYFLNQQLKTIQEELGGNTPDKEISEMRERAKLKKWNKSVEEVFNKETEELIKLFNDVSSQSDSRFNLGLRSLVT